MRKIAFFAIACLFFLSSCSGRDLSQAFIDVRAEYLAGDVTLSANLSADYGDRRYDYVLSYTGDGKSGEVNILSPEEVSGISAQIDKDKRVSLKCDGVLIDTGVLYGSGTTPVEALPLIVNAIREGYVAAVYHEQIDGCECFVAELDETPAGSNEKTLYTLWFSTESNALLRAEIAINGFTVISAVFE